MSIPDGPLRHNRRYVTMSTGMLTVELGAGVSRILYPVLALAETRSPFDAGAVVLCQTIPYLILYLPAGALVDRLDRRLVMVASCLIRALALASVLASVELGALPIAQLAIVAFVDGGAVIFFELSEIALLPQMVSKERLPTAVAVNQGRESAGSIAGPALGGLALGISYSLAWTINLGLSVAALCGFLWFYRILDSDRSQDAPVMLWHDVLEGLKWIFRQGFFRILVPLMAAINLTFGALPLIEILRAREFGASSSLVGLLLAIGGLGGLVGSMAAAHLQRHIAAALVVAGALWAWAVALAGLMLAPNVAVMCIFAPVIPFAGVVFNVVINAWRYRVTPEPLLARAQSATRLISHGAIPLGALLGGVIGQELGGKGAFAVMLSAMCIIALAGTAWCIRGGTWTINDDTAQAGQGSESRSAQRASNARKHRQARGV